MMWQTFNTPPAIYCSVTETLHDISDHFVRRLPIAHMFWGTSMIIYLEDQNLALKKTKMLWLWDCLISPWLFIVFKLEYEDSRIQTQLLNSVLNETREQGNCAGYLCAHRHMHCASSSIYVIVTRGRKWCIICLHYIEFSDHDELHDAEWRRVHFHNVSENLYCERVKLNIDLATNELILSDAPNEAILVKINNKIPGLGLQLDASELNLLYKDK